MIYENNVGQDFKPRRRFKLKSPIMRRFYIIYTLFCLLPLTIEAQQLPAVAFYQQNWTLLNPASIPREAIDLRTVSTLFNLNYRRQQHVVPSQAPTILDGRVEHLMSSDGDNYTKLSAFINNENDGLINTTSLNANYARLMKLGFRANRTRARSLSFGDLALGGTLTFRRRTIRADEVVWNNPSLFSPIQHNYLSLNVGGFWYVNLPHREKLKWSEYTYYHYEMEIPEPYGYLGVSTIQTLQAGQTDYFRDVNHWNGIAGVVWRHLELSTWLRYVPNLVYVNQNDKTYPISTNLSLRYSYKLNGDYRSKNKQLGNTFWVGVGLTSAKTINLECGYRTWLKKGLKQNSNSNYLQVGAAYTGFPISSQAISHPSNIEINISWNFSKN